MNMEITMKKMIIAVLCLVAFGAVADEVFYSEFKNSVFTFTNTNAFNDIKYIDTIELSIPVNEFTNTVTTYHTYNRTTNAYLAYGAITNNLGAYTSAVASVLYKQYSEPIRLMPNDKFILTLTYTNYSFIRLGLK